MMGYVVSIRVRGFHICGGCLISEDLVLTAAQCIYLIHKHGGSSYINASVLIGTNNLLIGGSLSLIRDTRTHYKYNDDNPIGTSNFDIGIIQVGLLINLHSVIKSFEK